MAIKDWSTTPANNNGSVLNGFAPENWAPSQVNNVLRIQMANHKTQWLDAEWFDRGDSGLSRASTTSFKITGDVTAEYVTGRRLKCFDTTTLYATVASSSYGAPDTTINVTMDSGTLSTSLSSVALGILRPTNISIPSITGLPGLGVSGTSSLSGGVTMKTTLNVEGATSLSGNCVAKGTFLIEGAVTISGSTTLKGTTTHEAATVCKTTLNVEGNTSLSGTVTIKGITTHEAATVLKTTLNVEGNTSLSGAVTIKGITTHEAATVLKTTLNVEGATTLSGAVVCKSTLTVNGASITGGGDWVKISSATASGSSSISFTGLDSTYRTYVVTMSHVMPATDATSLNIQVSTDNGSSWKSGASDYGWSSYGLVSNASAGVSASQTGDASDSKINWNSTGSVLSNVATEELAGTLWIYDPSSATDWTRFVGTGTHVQSDSNLATNIMSAMYRSTTAVNGIRFIMASGNISTGVFTLYGIKP